MQEIKSEVQKIRSELVVLLGHENDAQGKLSSEAKSRIRTLVSYLAQCESPEDISVVTTGGFGDFNPSNVPHGRLLIEALGQEDLQGIELVGFVNSSGTIQDALGVLRLVNETRSDIRSITLVTNRFHAARAEWIFARLFPLHPIRIVCDLNEGTKKQKRHEIRAKNNLRHELPDFANLPFPLEVEADQEMLRSELAHYDNLSYLPIAGIYSIIYFWSSNVDFSDAPKTGLISFLIVALPLTILLLQIYARFSGTASSLRHTLMALGYYFRRPYLGTSQNRFEKPTLKVQSSILLIVIVSWLGVAAFKLGEVITLDGLQQLIASFAGLGALQFGS